MDIYVCWAERDHEFVKRIPGVSPEGDIIWRPATRMFVARYAAYDLARLRQVKTDEQLREGKEAVRVIVADSKKQAAEAYRLVLQKNGWYHPFKLHS